MTRFLLIIFAAFFLLNTANSQIRKGALFVGGSLGVAAQKGSSQPGGDSETNGLYFSPAIGKAIKENLILGANLLTSYSDSENDFSSGKRRSYGAGVFLRKYLPLGKGFYLFGEGSVRGAFRRDEFKHLITPNNVTETKEWSVTAGIYPGVAYAINNKIQLEIGLNNLAYVQYNNTKTESPNAKTKNNGLDIGTNLGSSGALVVGLRFLLNRY